MVNGPIIAASFICQMTGVGFSSILNGALRLNHLLTATTV